MSSPLDDYLDEAKPRMFEVHQVVCKATRRTSNARQRCDRRVGSYGVDQCGYAHCCYLVATQP